MLIGNRPEALLDGTYTDIASEYYNSRRHPTCANFRDGSFQLINKWLGTLIIADGWFCEIGPGKSVTAEVLASQGKALTRSILIDSSLAMLQYAKLWATSGASLVQASAFMLPLASESIQLLVASLGDPYNTQLFWKEAYRVLTPGGIFLYTSPSYDWAVNFRTGKNMKMAEFELADGRRVNVPSIIYPAAEQAKLFEQHGLALKQCAELPIRDLKSELLSPKLGKDCGPTTSVVTGYLLQRK